MLLAREGEVRLMERRGSIGWVLLESVGRWGGARPRSEVGGANTKRNVGGGRSCRRRELRKRERGHPKATSLKIFSLLFRELCAKLFDGNSASDNLSYATSQTPSRHGSSSFHVAPLQLMDTPSVNIDEDDFFSNHTTQPPPSAASPSGNPNKRAKLSNPRPRVASVSLKQPSSASPKASITVDDLALEMQKAL
ncbi:unnamed protein product [Lactuca saligna]|uniref:Uncharacterized protein n=1 Tax=Lactuca saligna TaxID=75948 RepID=A0AA35UYA8_LACSI|nr:unnamed protein product [Lactuca saligna]